MRQTLFYIPHELYGLPVFGFGWLLIAWAAFSISLLVWQTRRHGLSAETKSYLPVLAVVGLAICFILPVLEEGSNGGPFAQLRQLFMNEPAKNETQPLGLPIRGYGVMLLLGIICGVGLAAQRARRMGLNPEVIYSLAFWMFVGGIGGARAFYVIQKWDEFRQPTIAGTIGEILKFTEGGLVVYGSLIGGLVAAILFCRKKRLSALAIGDLIAPSLAAGLALGRIGCLMNGCCWGGQCETPWLGVTFPLSPPYLQQLHDGELLGLRLSEPTADGTRVVEQVEANSRAADAGLEPGDRISSLRLPPLDQIKRAFDDRDMREPVVRAETSKGIVRWYAADLPRRSRPVHPTQIYSSINAALLALLLWFFYPFRRRDGEVFALMLTLYPITRILLEEVRVDEPGVLGTPLSISQVVSLGLLGGAILLWGFLLTRPRQRCLPAV